MQIRNAVPLNANAHNTKKLKYKRNVKVYILEKREYFYSY